MRVKLRDVMVYLCSRYPRQRELSKARLTKMVYLADWRSAITRGTQITDTEWIYNHYGPYVVDVERIALEDPAFETEMGTNIYGNEKTIIRIKPGTESESLTKEERASLDHVIAQTSSMNWDEFIRLVYSTFPVLTQERYAPLDLVELATEYKDARERYGWDVPAAPTAQTAD